MEVGGGRLKVEGGRTKVGEEGEKKRLEEERAAVLGVWMPGKEIKMERARSRCEKPPPRIMGEGGLSFDRS